MSRDPLFFLAVTAMLLAPAALLLAGAAMLAAPASGAPRGSMPCDAAFYGEHTGDLPIPQNVGARSDTLWFGGDDGNGIAMYGGAPNDPIYWDFETPGSNGFQGWTSEDMTANPGIYFGRVTAQNFIDHGDECVPMIEHTPGEPTVGEIWCGIHRDEADLRDFISGMGYQCEMCQRAFSPEFSIDPDNDDIDIAFTYFAHSELRFDYTYIDIHCFDSYHELIDEYEIRRISGIKGDYTAPVVFDEDVEVPAGTLDPSTESVKLVLFFEADGVWADDDGLWDSPCGPIAADNITIEVGSSSGYYDFETGEDGWTFDRCVPHGIFMHIVEAATYELWLEAAGQACDCPLSGDALTVVDEENSPYDPPGMAPGQQERLISGTVPRYGFDPPAWNTCIVEYDMFFDFAANTGLHWVEGYTYYPCITPMNPVPHWSKRYGADLGGWGGPFCGLFRHNYMTLNGTAGTMMPAEWDSMKAIFDIVAACDIFGIPTSICINEGQSNGSPVFDNIRVGLTNSPDAPPISLITGGLFHDGFGQNYPTYLEPSDRGNSNIAYDLSREDPEDNDWHGDSSGVVGPAVTTEESRWLAKMCFRVAKKGPRQDCIPEYQEWKARLSSDPEEGWVCALMDSAETATGALDRYFASYFHEDDPGFNPSFPDYSESQEILPDLTFVPGTRIEYYFASYWYDGGAPPDEYFFLPEYDTRYDFDILPMMELKPNEEYTVQWPSVLYVDAYNRGAEPYINALLEELELAYDRFDYLYAYS